MNDSTQSPQNEQPETEGSENLSDLRGGIHALYALTESDVQSSMFERTGAYQRQEKMASNIVAHRFPAGPGPQHPWEPPRRKCIVVAYPLCDNVLPYSVGIHTCWVRFLDDSSIQRFSGIWFEEV